VAAFRGASINIYDLYTTSLRRFLNNAESVATAATHPIDILCSKVQAVGWAGLARVSFDVLSDLEDSLDAEPFEHIYVGYYVSSLLLTILSLPDAIAPGAHANIVNYLVQNESTIFNDEYLPFTPDDNLIVAHFIIATTNQVSPVVIGMLHLAWSDPVVAQAFREFSSDSHTYNHCLSGSPSLQDIAHLAHCQTPVWPFEVDLSDGEVEFIAALCAVAIFTFHDGSFALMK
jgi:hypothetical protein